MNQGNWREIIKKGKLDKKNKNKIKNEIFMVAIETRRNDRRKMARDRKKKKGNIQSNESGRQEV